MAPHRAVAYTRARSIAKGCDTPSHPTYTQCASRTRAWLAHPPRACYCGARRRRPRVFTNCQTSCRRAAGTALCVAMSVVAHMWRLWRLKSVYCMWLPIGPPLTAQDRAVPRAPPSPASAGRAADCAPWTRRRRCVFGAQVVVRSGAQDRRCNRGTACMQEQGSQGRGLRRTNGGGAHTGSGSRRFAGACAGRQVGFLAARAKQ